MNMTDHEHLLHRQVHPSWIQQGRPSSQTFTPTQKDEGLLSVHDGNLIDAQESFEHYTKELGMKSDGVVTVTVAEVQAVGLTWRPDPDPFPEHAVIDFTALSSKSQIKAKATALNARALDRNWTYRP